MNMNIIYINPTATMHMQGYVITTININVNEQLQMCEDICV